VFPAERYAHRAGEVAFPVGFLPGWICANQAHASLPEHGGCLGEALPHKRNMFARPLGNASGLRADVCASKGRHNDRIHSRGLGCPQNRPEVLLVHDLAQKQKARLLSTLLAGIQHLLERKGCPGPCQGNDALVWAAARHPIHFASRCSDYGDIS
jgi:hypothetical protein